MNNEEKIQLLKDYREIVNKMSNLWETKKTTDVEIMNEFYRLHSLIEANKDGDYFLIEE